MSEQARDELQAQLAADYPAGQARELRSLITSEPPIAPLPPGTGNVSSQDQKLRERVNVTAVLACVYSVSLVIAHMVPTLVVGKMIRNKLTDFAPFQTRRGYSFEWSFDGGPGLLIYRITPYLFSMFKWMRSLMMGGFVGLLYVACGCCATRKSSSICAFCFCCSSAWKSCSLCLALVISLPTVPFLAATCGDMQAYLDLCDPSMCLENITDWPSNGQEDTRRELDCLVSVGAYPERPHMSRICPITLFAGCRNDQDDHFGQDEDWIPDDGFDDDEDQDDHFGDEHWLMYNWCGRNPNATVLKWQDGNATYFLAARGKPCPCESEFILDWVQCQRALKSFPSPWNVGLKDNLQSSKRVVREDYTKIKETEVNAVPACFVRGTKKHGRIFEFAVPPCEFARRGTLDFVCAAAVREERKRTEKLLISGCDYGIGDAEEHSSVLKETRPAWLLFLREAKLNIRMPDAPEIAPSNPLRSCSIKRDGVRFWQMMRQEARTALRAVQIMNIVRIAFFIPGIALSSVAFRWGWLLWKQVSLSEVQMAQQPLLPTMTQVDEQYAGNAPAVGNDGV